MQEEEKNCLQKGQTSGGHKPLDIPVRTASPLLRTKLLGRGSACGLPAGEPGPAAGVGPSRHIAAAFRGQSSAARVGGALALTSCAS